VWPIVVGVVVGVLVVGGAIAFVVIRKRRKAMNKE
jgi:LPXTG-motif cell wall-anchored protein